MSQNSCQAPCDQHAATSAGTHLKELRLPTILREYDKVARQWGARSIRWIINATCCALPSWLPDQWKQPQSARLPSEHLFFT
jgi:hypothetical protein